jgi:DNA-binding response OmpR family regulator
MAETVILVVEDDSSVRSGIEDAFAQAGYAVMAASSGADAIDLLDEHWVELSAVVTDIRIGNGPDGWELAKRARELDRNIAIVYVTADSAHHWSARGVPKSVLIHKPFASAQLVTAVSGLLNDTS